MVTRRHVGLATHAIEGFEVAASMLSVPDIPAGGRPPHSQCKLIERPGIQQTLWSVVRLSMGPS